MMIVNLLLQYALLAAGLAASLLLFLSLKRELRSSNRRQQKRFDEMAHRLMQAEEPAVIATEAAPRPAHAGFNLNKRVQAMRLLRRGENVAHIAAALGVPRAEVELLMRVQRMSAAAAAGMAGQDEGTGGSSKLTAQDSSS